MPTNVYIKDSLKHSVSNSFRRESITALTKGMGIKHIFFDGNISDVERDYKPLTCFDVLVQKATTWAGDPLDLQLYRQNVFEYCSIRNDTIPSDFTVLLHRNTRVFHRQDDLAAFLSSHRLIRNV